MAVPHLAQIGTGGRLAAILRRTRWMIGPIRSMPHTLLPHPRPGRRGLQLDPGRQPRPLDGGEVFELLLRHAGLGCLAGALPRQLGPHELLLDLRLGWHLTASLGTRRGDHSASRPTTRGRTRLATRLRRNIGSTWLASPTSRRPLSVLRPSSQAPWLAGVRQGGRAATSLPLVSTPPPAT